MRYWVWLHDCLGYRSKRIHQIMEDFSTPEQLFHADEAAVVNSGLFSPKELDAISERSLAAADSILERCKSLGISVVTFADERYPRGLREISEPPAVLFCQGNIELLQRKGIAVVGTRHPTLTGKKAAFELGFHLSEKGYTIVSGAADGIDTQAHRGALQGTRLTIGVLGGGVNHRYLSKNKILRDEIARYGLLLSEYPPDMEPVSYTFPRRNRIISALSVCTVVVEAGQDSGSLLTAIAAREQGKPVFALPGSLDSPYSAGSNALLTEGARAAVNYEDILRRLETPALPDEDEEEIGQEAIRRIRREGKRQKKEAALPKTTAANVSAVPQVPENETDGSAEDDEEEEIHEDLIRLSREAGKRQETKAAPTEATEEETATALQPSEKDTAVSAGSEDVEKIHEDLIRLFWGAGKRQETKAAPAGTTEEEAPTVLQSSEKEATDPSEGDDVEKIHEDLIRLFRGAGKRQETKAAPTGTTEEEATTALQPSEKDTAAPEPSATVRKRRGGRAKQKRTDKGLFNMNEKSPSHAPTEAKDDNFLKNMLTENALSVYHTISETPIYVDLLKEAVHLEIGEVLSALTELELIELVCPLPGGKYVRKS